MVTPPPDPRHSRILRLGRPLAATGVFLAGAAAAAAISTATPAKAETCIPPLCIPPLPSVPLPSVPVPSTPMPSVPVPSVPVPTSASGSSGTPPADATPAAADDRNPEEAAAESRLSATSSVRVRGRGRTRTVVITVALTKDARVDALLSRSSRKLARRAFTGHAGRNQLLLRVGGTPKPGAAKLALTIRSASGEVVRMTHQLRLPR